MVQIQNCCFNRDVRAVTQRIYDYLEYETSSDRTVIIGSDHIDDLSTYIDACIENAITRPGRREEDAEFVVHSTSRDS